MGEAPFFATAPKLLNAYTSLYAILIQIQDLDDDPFTNRCTTFHNVVFHSDGYPIYMVLTSTHTTQNPHVCFSFNRH